MPRFKPAILVSDGPLTVSAAPSWSGFEYAKQISEILPEVLSEKNLELLRGNLETFLARPEFPVIKSWINDEKTFVYISDCFTSMRLLSRKALGEAQNGSTVVFYAENTLRKDIVYSLLRIMLNEIDVSLGSNSIKESFFDAIPQIKKEFSSLDFRLGKTLLSCNVWSSLNKLMDDLLSIIKEPSSENVCCFISWIGDLDYANDKITMIENAGFMYIIDQLTAFAKNNGCKMTIGGFQGSMPDELLRLMWRNG